MVYSNPRIDLVSQGRLGQRLVETVALLAWVKTLPLVPVIYLLGDGHCGIWSLFAQMEIEGLTDEVLDWYHLKENLYKVDATDAVLEALSSQLWEGQLQPVLGRLSELDNDSAKRFSAYLTGARHPLGDEK